MNTTADVLKLSRHVLCQECALVYAHATKKVNSIPFWKHYLKKTNGIFLLELLEEQITGGKNCDCELLRTEIQKNRRKLVNVLGELNHVEREDCGYDRELIELKLIEKLIQNIDQKMKQLFMSHENLFEPSKERSCPMCAMIDLLDCAKIKSEQNRNEWMNVFEQLWSIQSKYPHLLCHECIDRLELIQNRLGTLSGFHNCELRRMRMLKTFAKLTRSIQRFQISKGRVFKSDMEKMTKVFDNFISQWDLYQSGSEYDQQSSTAENVCHCTRTLNKSRSLQKADTSWEEREEHAYLMDVANMLSELNLTEIVSGCPLNFDHNLDADCFNRERWDKLTDISDCSQD
ncbi:hypothetical protein CAEBREN_13958 [Caenorhabditis brenneri]|uniref:Uncharacterized protein n=1 Tax=Caenorhabditis brenneri TaxID=135651 RepID=G0PM96_CAEBE|nr:hypothetical protein CAEBREN_13958 [Caenorhabditis brenneri]